MAYRKKAENIIELYPEIVVVPECESIEEQTSKRLWFGDNLKKGLGMYSYSSFDLTPHEQYNPDFKYVVPIKVSGEINFTLIAIWAMNDTQDRSRRYIGQVYLALNYYKEMLDKPVIIIGDFNSNMIWDYTSHYGLCGNFSDVVNMLKSKSIYSAYHHFYSEEFGKETRPTLFMYRNQKKSYHVDYCFASDHFKVQDLQIGESANWIGYSDHMPVMVNIRKILDQGG
jgi:exodeoxyribonuclease III